MAGELYLKAVVLRNKIISIININYMCTYIHTHVNSGFRRVVRLLVIFVFMFFCIF